MRLIGSTSSTVALLHFEIKLANHAFAHLNAETQSENIKLKESLGGDQCSRFNDPTRLLIGRTCKTVSFGPRNDIIAGDFNFRREAILISLSSSLQYRGYKRQTPQMRRFYELQKTISG